jgi:hypothetical protein
MMNQEQLDKLFREKLQYYQKPAPAGAWNRIESTLEKKTKLDFLWWKVAASILLVAGGTYLFWFHNPPVDQHPLARIEKQSTDAPQTVEPTVPEMPAENQSQPEKKESKARATTDNPGKEREPATSQEEIINLATVTKEPITVVEPSFTEAPGIDTVTPTVDTPRKDETKSTITLTISSEEANQYLNKSGLAEATSSEKKPSTLKKFLKKANDLKSNQDPFGDLRERKNEILALNFKSDKREQNK